MPLAAVMAFLKHHLHDVRNDLNALNLETMLLDLHVTGGEGAESVRRIQELLHQSAGRLGTLSRKFSEASPNLDVLPVQFILASWRDEWTSSGAKPEITWEASPVEASVKVDPVHAGEVFREWLSNARQYASAVAVVSLSEQDGSVIFRLTERKAEPLGSDILEWGLRPFARPRKGSYGLGLWRVRNLARANGGTWRQRYSPEENSLVSEFSLPAVSSS